MRQPQESTTNGLFQFFLLCFTVFAHDDLIVPPSPNGKVIADPVVLFFGQGAQIRTNLYAPLAKSIQNALPIPFWFASPGCPGNDAGVPGCLEKGMERVKTKMISMGLDWNAAAVFYGGHSQGGAVMPSYLYERAQGQAMGMILLGSFLAREWRTGTTTKGRPQYEYPVPTLTIGAELDGLCRVTRIAESLYNQVSFSETPDSAIRRLPVTVIRGMNHFGFASGNAPPKFVASHDLRSEVGEEEGHALVAADVAAWIQALLANDDENNKHWKALEERVSETAVFLQPIVDAFTLEGYAMFLPPCNCEAKDEYWNPETGVARSLSGRLPYRMYGTCVSEEYCTGGVPWTSDFAMPIMAGVAPKDFTASFESAPAFPALSIAVKATDSLHDVNQLRPSPHLPHIHGNKINFANPGNTGHKNAYNPPAQPICRLGPASNCTLNITTVTQNVYSNSGEFDLWRFTFSSASLDTGFLPLAARELKAKLKSRQAVYEAAGLGIDQAVDLVETDTPVSEGGTGDRCGEINQAAIDWALGKLPPRTAERFTAYGQKLVVGPDLKTRKAGPGWIWDPLRWLKNDNKGTVVVQSVPFLTENYNKYPCGEGRGPGEMVACSAGFHYCKLLSPARALEWMLIDGLRLNYTAAP